MTKVIKVHWPHCPSVLLTAVNKGNKEPLHSDIPVSQVFSAKSQHVDLPICLNILVYFLGCHKSSLFGDTLLVTSYYHCSYKYLKYFVVEFEEWLASIYTCDKKSLYEITCLFQDVQARKSHSCDFRNFSFVVRVQAAFWSSVAKPKVGCVVGPMRAKLFTSRNGIK